MTTRSSRTTPDRDGNAYRLQSVDRAVDLLELLGAAGSDGLSLGEIGDALGTSKSSAFALLRTLVAREFVVESGTQRTRRYRLGLALARLGDQVLSQISLLDVARPTLHKLTEETEWTSRIGVLQDGYAVILSRVEGPGIVRFRTNLAQRELPHSTAVGKAILSQLPEEAVRTIVAATGLQGRTENTITSVDALLENLALVRRRGFSVDDEEDSIGVICIGAPVFDHSGSCVAAVSVSGLRPALPDVGVDGLGATVRRHADEISRDLGLRGDAHLGQS